MSDDTIRYAFDQARHEPHWQREIELLERFNQINQFTHPDEYRSLLTQLFAEAEGANVSTPLALTRGHLVKLGRKVYINHGVQIAAAAPISIGHHTLIGPNVQLQTATHPVDPTERQRWAFWAKPISIGENVWIGANAIICGGVTIGNHSVIGAGSIVTRDIPACVLAAGNPARIIRELTPPDEATLYELNP